MNLTSENRFSGIIYIRYVFVMILIQNTIDQGWTLTFSGQGPSGPLTFKI